MPSGAPDELSDDELGISDVEDIDEEEPEPDGDADDEEDGHWTHRPANGAQPAKPRKKRQKVQAEPLFGVRASKAMHKETDNAERNRADRSRKYAARFKAALDLRSDIKIDVLCRVILQLIQRP